MAEVKPRGPSAPVAVGPARVTSTRTTSTRTMKGLGAFVTRMIHDAPLAEIAGDLRRGRIGAVEYVERLETRAAEVEPQVRSLVEEEGRWDRVREAAVALAERYPEPEDRPPLYGVPIAVKDVFHVDGLETRAGSKLPPEELTGEEAEAVTRMKAAGAIVLGKAVTTEFAYFDPGPTRNPNALEHTPGGSSSGSAAAVAAGVAPFAFGTQTIGSIIRPAAFCGVVGVKPTRDRIPTDGVIPFSTSVDHVGYFTQDIEGARLAAARLVDDWRTLSTPRERPTLGVPEGPYLDQADAVGREAFEDHVRRLEAAGYEVTRVRTMENIDGINERHERLTAADLATAHEAWFREYADRYAAETRELIEEGRTVPTADVARGRQGRHDLRERLEARMRDAGVDVWIAPAAPGPAPEGIDDTGDPIMNLPWTHSGLPTVALPAGTTADGRPLGVQCAAAFGADEDLLGWADGLAAALSE